MIENKIEHVIEKAKIRPDGYLEDVRNHCEEWNEKTGFFKMTENNWNKMASKWTPLKIDVEQQTEKCLFSMCASCSEGPSCKIDGVACQDPNNKQCEERNKTFSEADLVKMLETERSIAREAGKRRVEKREQFNEQKGITDEALTEFIRVNRICTLCTFNLTCSFTARSSCTRTNLIRKNEALCPEGKWVASKIADKTATGSLKGGV